VLAEARAGGAALAVDPLGQGVVSGGVGAASAMPPGVLQ
jgi:hypothetical protein